MFVKFVKFDTFRAKLYLMKDIRVTIFLFLAMFIGYHRAQAAGALLTISPPAGEFRVGSTFTATLLVDTRDSSVQGVRATLSYPSDILQVIKPVSDFSIITSWIETPVASNTDGILTFNGAMLPGIKTSAGTVLTLEFRVVAPGEARLSVRDAFVTRAGESGVNVFDQAKPAVYRAILPLSQGPVVESTTHPDPHQWYAKTTAEFIWAKEDFDAFSYLVDREAYTLPDRISEERESSAALAVTQDGVWYFHLAAQKPDGSWSDATHVAIRVDATVPKSSEIHVAGDNRNSKGSYRINFSATDAASGIARYEASLVQEKSKGPVPSMTEGLSQNFFVEASSPLTLQDSLPGPYTVVIRAYDRAGNFSESQADFTVTASWQVPWKIGNMEIPRTVPWLVAYAAVLAAMGLAAVLAREFLRHHRNLRKAIMRDTERAEEQLKKSLEQLGIAYQRSAEGVNISRVVTSLHETHETLEQSSPSEPPSPEPPPPPQ